MSLCAVSFFGMEASEVQRRTLRLLFIAQVISGIGIAIGSSVGALLAADIAGIGVSGLAISANVVGAALFAVPATAIVHRYGRRLSLAAGYATAALGSILLVSAAVRGRHLSLVVWATTIGAIIGPSLAPVAGRTVEVYGVPTLAGPFVFSAMLLGLAALLLFGLLRPDPAVVARELLGDSGAASSAGRAGMGEALRLVASLPAARLGVSAMAIGHVVMVGVMTMTPVHIRGAGHGAEHTLRIVGLVLSFHIAGMFAFAPVVGWLTDRIGRRPVIFAGIAILLTACAVAGTAGHDPVHLAGGLMLLGLGWSATMVAGSTLLSDAVSGEMRASAQGLSDLMMGLAGATAGALSGVVVEAWSYPTLTLLAALATAPLIVLVSLQPKPAKQLSPGD